MSLDDAVGQHFCHGQQFFAIHRIFKARQGGLRSQILPDDVALRLRCPRERSNIATTNRQIWRKVYAEAITTGGHSAIPPLAIPNVILSAETGKCSPSSSEFYAYAALRQLRGCSVLPPNPNVSGPSLRSPE